MNPNQHPPGVLTPTTPQGSRLPRAVLSNTEWKSKIGDHDEVWVQNLSDEFISMDVENGAGNPPQHVKIPRMREPYRITDEVTCEMLKKSNNFSRTLAKRRKGQPMLRVLTSEEAEAWYLDAAVQSRRVDPQTQQPDVAGMYEAGRKKYRDLTTVPTSEQGPGGFDSTHTFAPPKSVIELVGEDMNRRGYDGADPTQRREYDMANLGKQAVMVRDIVDPRVLWLCNQVANDVPNHQLLSAPDLLGNLKDLSNLSEESLQHIVSHGRYKGVKVWANQELAKMASKYEIDDGAPGGTPGAPPSGAGYQGAPGAGYRGAPQYAPPQYAPPQYPGAPSYPGAPGYGPPPGYGPQGYAPQGPPGYAPPGVGVDAPVYQGPAGFSNAPAALSGAGVGRGAIVGPDGQPI